MYNSRSNIKKDIPPEKRWKNPDSNNVHTPVSLHMACKEHSNNQPTWTSAAPFKIAKPKPMVGYAASINLVTAGHSAHMGFNMFPIAQKLTRSPHAGRELWR